MVHNLGYSADELTLRPRQAHFDDHGHTLNDEKPDVLFAFFGFNESFAGPAGLDKFKKDVENFITVSTTTRYNGKPAPRLVLFSPIAHEDLKNPHITDGRKNNANIALYTAAMAELAGKHGVVFVDLFTPSRKLFEASSHPLTINGIHLSDEGYRQLAPRFVEALFGPPASIDAAKLEAPMRPSRKRTCSSSMTTARSTAATSLEAGRRPSASSISRPRWPACAR